MLWARGCSISSFNSSWDFQWLEIAKVYSPRDVSQDSLQVFAGFVQVSRVFDLRILAFRFRGSDLSMDPAVTSFWRIWCGSSVMTLCRMFKHVRRQMITTSCEDILLLSADNMTAVSAEMAWVQRNMMCLHPNPTSTCRLEWGFWECCGVAQQQARLRRILDSAAPLRLRLAVAQCKGTEEEVRALGKQLQKASLVARDWEVWESGVLFDPFRSYCSHMGENCRAETSNTLVEPRFPNFQSDPSMCLWHFSPNSLATLRGS